MPNRIPADLLEVFVCTAESKNLFDAALKLGVSQPTLSRQLKLLEDQLPSPLFNYSGRSKVLTLFGETLYESLKGRLSGLTDFVDQVSSHFSDPRQARLRIVGRREVLHPFICALKFPGILQFSFLTGQAVIDALVSRKADLSVSQRVPDVTNIVARPVFKRGMSLVVPKILSPKKLVADGTRDFKNLSVLLSQIPCLSFSPDLHSIKDLLPNVGLLPSQLKIAKVCGDWSILRELVENGEGWALLPSDGRIDEKKVWILEVPHGVVPAVPFFLLYHKELSTIPWFKEFVQHFNDLGQI